jgi:predicted amidophosphoribosyltransferase
MDPRSLICSDCVRSVNGCRPIRGDAPEGVDRIVSCADHDGVPRALLAAFKFRRLTGLADLIAGFIADAAGPGSENALLVPIPPARLRTWMRGFDPVAMLAELVSVKAGFRMPDEAVLVRHGSGRQRGRGRAGRLSDPPDLRPTGEAEESVRGREVTLIDDVMTTGATLATAAAALRNCGAMRISALTFTRRL